MNKSEFDIMRSLCECSGTMTQRIISEETGYSLGKVNQIVSILKRQGLMTQDGRVTLTGIQLMEPYEVKNAIILAAGMSKRFAPISYEIPKGLMVVKGQILIERQIQQLRQAGVKDIVVVVGCMMEKFFYLRQKYDVKLVVNNEFSTKNTHSSLYAARDFLSNTYICCSDIYYPQNMFHLYEYRAYYCAVYLPGTAYGERGLVFNHDGLITHTDRPSHNQWVMQGHAYFSQSFSDEFRPVLENCFGKPGVENMYWEGIWAEYVREIPMWIKQCTSKQILEFDHLEDMQLFDPDCIQNNRIKLFENICNVLHCKTEDITEISKIEQGLNNQSFRFKCCGRTYVYRHPGSTAERAIDRKKEAAALYAANKLGIDKTLIYIDENDGWKISKFIETTEEFDFTNPQHSKMLAQNLRTLHDSRVLIGFRFEYQKDTDVLIEFERKADPLTHQKLQGERHAMQSIFEFLEQHPWQISLCHNDLYEPNLLVKDNTLSIIDWEYGGDADIGFDICKLFAGTDMPFDQINRWVYPYFGRDITIEEKTHLVACAAVVYYYWYIWGVHAKRKNESVSAFLIKWYDRMVRFRTAATDYIEAIRLAWEKKSPGRIKRGE